MLYLMRIHRAPIPFDGVDHPKMQRFYTRVWYRLRCATKHTGHLGNPSLSRRECGFRGPRQ